MRLDSKFALGGLVENLALQEASVEEAGSPPEALPTCLPGNEGIGRNQVDQCQSGKEKAISVPTSTYL